MNGNPKTGIPDNFIDLVEAAGRFVVGRDGDTYYLPNEGGSPQALHSRAGQARVLAILGLRRSTPKLKAMFMDLEDHARQGAPRARVEATAAFNQHTSELRVNLGGGAVFYLNRQEVRMEGAYSDGLLFIDEHRFQSIESSSFLEAWGQLDPVGLPHFTEALLGNLPPSQDSLLDPAEQRAAVLAWWLGAFLKDVATARPMLALIGPPACGKTVTGRLLGTGFYGYNYDVSGVAAGSRAEKDIAASLVERALVVRDDINSAPPGIMDLLCSAATGQRFDLSTFHETLAMTSYDPRAILAITAHTPKWALRGDVLSRLLVLRFAHPPKSTITEQDRKNAVMANRAGLWAETLWLLYQGLVASEDRFEVVSRFPDWEMIVRRALRAAGREDALVSALRKMERSRVRVAADAEPLLDALASFAEAEVDPVVKENRDVWRKAGELHAALAHHMGVSTLGSGHYSTSSLRNPTALGKFMSKLAGEASAVVNVERRRGNQNSWLYRIRPKVSE